MSKVKVSQPNGGYAKILLGQLQLMAQTFFNSAITLNRLDQLIFVIFNYSFSMLIALLE